MNVSQRLGVDMGRGYFSSLLSPDDVVRIIEQFQTQRDNMTQQGYRHPDPYFNNHCRLFPWRSICIAVAGRDNKYQDCGEQTQMMNNHLSSFKYEDNWNFYMDAGFGHAWGYAFSSNPADPIVWFDTRSGQISVGKPCETCKPWFGPTNYNFEAGELPPRPLPPKNKR